MVILYEIHFSSGKIEKVRVERFSEKTVWVERGFNYIRREAWRNAYYGFFHTLREAQKFGADKLQKEIDALHIQVNHKIAVKRRVMNIEEEYVGEPPVFEKTTSGMIKL